MDFAKQTAIRIQVSTPRNTPNRHNFYSRMTLIYLGTGPRNLPLFIRVTADQTNFIQTKLQLEREQDHLRETKLSEQIFKTFFDRSLLMMGILEIVENDSDLVYVMVNEACSVRVKRSVENMIGKRAGRSILSKSGVFQRCYNSCFCLKILIFGVLRG